MKFFIDFEATQFKHKIISIGCVAEDGSYYETLVKAFYSYEFAGIIYI